MTSGPTGSDSAATGWRLLRDKGLERKVLEATKLKEQISGILQTPGSLRLVQTLLKHDLVDELRLMVFPVILGTGRRLFGETTEKMDWRLTEAKPVGPDGVLVLTYERAR